MITAPSAFLSYASCCRAWALDLAANLEQHQIKVFVDQRGIQPGESWWSGLQRGLSQAQGLVLVVNPQAMASAWVAQEMAAFDARMPGHALIPVVLSWAPLPDFLATRQQVDFEDAPYDQALRKLVASLKGIPESLIEPCALKIPAQPRHLPSGLWRRLCTWVAPGLNSRSGRIALAIELGMLRDTLLAFPSGLLAANAALVHVIQDAEPAPTLIRLVEIVVNLELRDHESALPLLDELRRLSDPSPALGLLNLPASHLERIGKLLGVPGAELASLGPWGAAAAALAERLLAAAEQDPLFSVQLQTGAGLPRNGTPMDRLCDRLVSLSEQPAVQAKGLGRETALRLGAFRQIFQELSAIPDSTWVGGLRRDGRTDGPVTPFVRVAVATANRPLDITLRTTPFQSALSRDYRLDTSLKRNLAELRQTERSWTNDRKLRIVSVEVHRQETHTEILLEAGRSRYEDYLCTHWAFANLPARATSRARAQLFKRGLLSDLDGPPHFPNQLGVSAFVVSKDGYILLPVQARSSVASAGLVVPPVSGSADWEPGYVDGDPIATQDIRREALEEMDLDHEHIVRVVPLALCRDLLRGGTPELFFVIFTSLDVGDLRLSLEHERIASSPQAVQNARMIPALLGADHTPFPGLEDRLVDYQRELEVTVDSLQERSPFVDALLHLYLEWCQPCLDRREDRV